MKALLSAVWVEVKDSSHTPLTCGHSLTSQRVRHPPLPCKLVLNDIGRYVTSRALKRSVKEVRYNRTLMPYGRYGGL